MQAGIGFCIWVLYGIWFAKRQTEIRRIRNVLAGPLMLIAGMLVLAFSMYATYALGGLQNGSLTFGAFVSIILAGLLFVHCQCLGARLILSVALKSETPNERRTSDIEKEI